MHSVKMTSFCRKVARLQISFDSFWEVNSLNLFSWSSQFNVSDNKVQEIILYFSSHPNILKFKEKFQLDKKFSFQHVFESSVRKVINSVSNFINKFSTDNDFPDISKLSHITPVFKKLNPIDNANYRALRILPLVGKVLCGQL